MRRAAVLAAAIALPADAGRSKAWLGFEPTPWQQHFQDVPLQPTGTVPSWVNGTYFRNGPGQWGADEWFTATAYVAALRFENGAVKYTGRFQETEGYWSACVKAGACEDKVRPKTGGDAPVTFTQIDGSYVATTEGGALSFDPHTLAIIESPFKFGPDALGTAQHLAPSHDVMLADGVRLHHYAELMRIKGQVEVYEIAAHSRVRKVIATIPDDDGPGPTGNRYQHQTLGTADWYVMFEGPCMAIAFDDPYSWHPEKGTRVRLVNRHTGASLLYHMKDNYFTTHQINAYVDGDDVVADLVSSECGCYESTKAFGLKNLRSDNKPMHFSHLTHTFRIRMNTKTPNITVTPTPMNFDNDWGVEFPTVSPKVLGLPYTYVYMSQLSTDASGWYDVLVKMNVNTGAMQSFSKPDWYVGEPVFAPAPGAKSEDDGVAIAIALDVAKNSSLLVILDAKTWTLTATAPCPETLPFMYHGRFFGPKPLN